jgi:hypothetical protein
VRLEFGRRMVSTFEGDAAPLLVFMGYTRSSFVEKLFGSKLSTRRDSSSSMGS